MTVPEMDAFAREAERIDRTLHDIGPDAWDRPALGEWNVAQLVWHLVRQADRLHAYHDRPVSPDAPTVDRVEYCRRAADLAGDVAARAIEGAAGVAPETLPDLFSDAWRRSLRAVADPDALIETVVGPMRTGDYAATRVVELVVHHMDVRRALDLPPDSDPVAARLVTDLLETMLDGPRPRNLGRTRFLLAATGRIPHDDPRFPVLR
jgi:uncharacterized protein (TIGR03083 family)